MSRVLRAYRSYYFVFGLVILLTGVATYWFYDYEKRAADTSAEMTRIFLKIERRIGYSGFIHEFKNHLLRPDNPNYAKRALLASELAKEEIESLQALVKSAGIEVDLSELQNTLSQYRNAIGQISNAHRRGVPVREIDQQVRVSDKAATNVLADLQLQVDRLLTTRRESTERWGWLSLLLFLIVLVTLAVSLINSWRRNQRQQQLEYLRQQHELKLSKQHSDEMDILVGNLERSNAELENFAYAASHDLRTPLRGVSSIVSFLRDDDAENLSSTSLKNLDKLEVRVNRVEALLDDMLAYSQAGRRSGSPEQIASSQVVNDSIALLSPPKHFTFLIASDLPTLTTFVPPLQQVFLNLIGNAVKYHDKDSGVIEVKAEIDNEFVRFTVSDDGPGIDPKFHERVFEMFQRLERKDNIEGTGLGLALIQKVVRQFGGNIWLESRPGEGSSFHFTWPMDVKRSQVDDN